MTYHKKNVSEHVRPDEAPIPVASASLWQFVEMMNLTIRKIIVLGLTGIIFLTANIVVVANWIGDTGVSEKAGWIRHEFLTGTALILILVFSILLVSPKNASGKAIGFSRRCPVCDNRLIGNPSYCGECGSKV